MTTALKRLAIILVSILATYSWLGFLLIPSVALTVINQQLAVHAKEPAQLQRLELNPFTLEVYAWDFQLGAADNQAVSLQHLYGKLALDSLWTQSLHLEDVQLHQAHTYIILNKQGELNLTQLFSLPAATDTAQPSDAAPLTVLIDQLQLQRSRIRFNDQRQRDAVDVTFDDLNITLKHFDTRPASNSALQLTAQANDGTQLNYTGDLSLSPLTSTGHIQLKDAKLKSWWPYVREHFSAQLKDGRISLDTQYELRLDNDLQFKATQLSAQLRSLALDQDQQPLLRAPNLSISDSSFDLAAHKLRIGKASASTLEAWAQIDKNGVINWQKLLPKPAAATTANKANTPSTPSKPWQIIVKQADFTQHSLHLADHSHKDPVALELSKLNLQLKDFDSLSKSPFELDLDTQVGEQGRLNSHAQVLLEPLKVDMTLISSDLDLRPAQAWISPYAHAELRSGLFNSDLKLQISDLNNLTLAVQGDAAIQQLHIRDTLRQRELLKWDAVDINGIAYALQANTLSIEHLVLQQPYVRFIINDNLTTNISELLIPQPPTATSTAAKDSPEFALHIGGIKINDGSANFADFSLTPNFATAIQQLNGSIGTLDNQTNNLAEVAIQGKVDRYAPVSIKGSLTPFDPLHQLDITTSFKHVELTTLTPYSGKFAGYRIHKGRLNLDLHYQINDGKLNATNKLLLEQLQLGERVDSPDAVDLPVRLAIALLKDSQGRIAIDLPVQGDLNNPEFKVGPIVWKTLRTLITRAVSAPFNFIAGLTHSSGKELSEVGFLPGESSINPQAAKSLDTLAVALQERPQLRLEVEGGSRAELDGPLLAQLRLKAAYQSAWYSILQSRGTKIGSSKEALEVPEAEKPNLLEGIYRTQLKQQPPQAWAELNKTERTQMMQSAVLASYAKSQQNLRRLAQARANNIKEYLIEHAKLDAERVYLIDVSSSKASADGNVISTLHLGSM